MSKKIWDWVVGNNYITRIELKKELDSIKKELDSIVELESYKHLREFNDLKDALCKHPKWIIDMDMEGISACPSPKFIATCIKCKRQIRLIKGGNDSIEIFIKTHKVEFKEKSITWKNYI